MEETQPIDFKGYIKPNTDKYVLRLNRRNQESQRDVRIQNKFNKG